MPAHRATKGNRTDCWQWGKTGKIYCGVGAKAKAEKQGRAVRASQAREKSLVGRAMKYHS